jgi:hypothetical protein
MVVAFIGQVLSAIARGCNNQVPASVYAAVIAEKAQQLFGIDKVRWTLKCVQAQAHMR